MSARTPLETHTLNYWLASQWLRGQGGPNWLRPIIACKALAGLAREGGRLGAAAMAATADRPGTTARIVNRDHPKGAA